MTTEFRQRPDVSAPTGGISPWSWGDRVVVEATLLLLAWGLSALGLALLGWFRWWAVVPIAMAIFLGVRRYLPRPSIGLDKWWVIAIVLSASIGMVNLLHPGEHLLTGRDGGTYLATAGWLASEGTLFVEARVDAFGTQEDLQFHVPGFYDRVGGREELEPQFMHMFPAMMATLIGAAGVLAGLAVNPIAGFVMLLALFSLARRFARPWAALLAMVVVGSSLVFLFYARTPFSEVLMATFLLSGLGLLGLAEDLHSRSLGVLAGVLLGATTLARLDGIVLLLPVTVYLLFRGSKDEVDAGLFRRARLGMYLTAVAGLAESLYVSPAYILERSRNVVPVLVGVLVLLVGYDLSAGRFEGIRSWIAQRRRLLFIVGASVFGLLLAYAWLIRPVAVEVAGGGYGLEILQQREGLAIDGTRGYAEMSVVWVEWYQGAAFIVLGFLGAVQLARSDLEGNGRRPGWLIIAVLSVFAVLYFWRPSINPDQIWAMRRFLTVVMPLGALAAAVAIDRVTELVKHRVGSALSSNATAGVLALALLVPPFVGSAPVWDVAEYRGLSGQFEELCDIVGPDGHVLVVGWDEGVTWTQSVRSYCGVPSAWIEHPDEQLVDEIRFSVENADGRLVIVSSEGPGRAMLVGPFDRLDITLSQRPAGVIPTELAIRVDG